jgi:hypothetical protein
MNAGGVDMDSSQEGNEKELASEVVESLGEPKESVDEINQSHDSVGHENTGDPLFVQKRLKQQKRAHDREMREMQARMAELQSQISPQNPQSFDANPYATPGSNNPGGVDETISKAVSYALAQRDQEERKAKAAEAAASISNHYQKLQHHLDQVADKYEDFDDVVRGDHAPFTATMRDAALMLPKKGPGSAGEVLYKLGKNPEELARISKLYPHEQAAELVALSHALISGGEQKGSSSRPLNQIKNNPVTNSVGVTEKTPISSIRDRMKKGTFK